MIEMILSNVTKSRLLPAILIFLMFASYVWIKRFYENKKAVHDQKVKDHLKDLDIQSAKIKQEGKDFWDNIMKAQDSDRLASRLAHQKYSLWISGFDVSSFEKDHIICGMQESPSEFRIVVYNKFLMLLEEYHTPEEVQFHNKKQP